MTTTMDFSDGGIVWLSELDMEDQSLMRHPDNLFSPTIEHFPPGIDYQSSVNIDLMESLIGLQRNDTHMAPLVPTMSYFAQTSPDAVINRIDLPMKIPKVNTWGISSGLQPPGDLIPGEKMSCHAQKRKECLLQQEQYHYQLQMASHLDGLSVSLPKPKDENHESVAPRTPTGICQRSATRQESCMTDVYNAAMNVSRDVPFSPSEPFLGYHKSGLLSAHRSGDALKYRAAPAKASNHTTDHILAERKRREKLSQRFIALSAIVPGLKKMDKASVLGDAIKYVKQLQERLKELEEQVPKKASVAVANARKSSLSCKASESTADVIRLDESNENLEGMQQPDIEVRMISKNVLIRVHCEKRKGVLVKSLAELEKLQLSVINANILSFTESTLDLTFSAQIEEGCELSAEDLVKVLQDLFKKLK